MHLPACCSDVRHEIPAVKKGGGGGGGGGGGRGGGGERQVFLPLFRQVTSLFEQKKVWEREHFLRQTECGGLMEPGLPGGRFKCTTC